MAESKTSMMGSRADMIGSKFDEVSRNSIWREHVRKEAKHCSMNGTFVVNPKSLIPIASKPTDKPRSADSHAAEEMDALRTTLARTSLPPQAKAKAPMTASQEIGWYWGEAEHSEFTHTRASCKETKYAESYVQMSGANPYAKST